MHRIKTIFFALSSKERISFVIAAAILVVSVIGLLVRLIYVKTDTVPARGGEYAEGFVGQPVYVNPVLAATDIDRGLIRLAFANLSSLAERIDSSKNERVWKVQLKPNLTWSDGRKLTSDDVVFTVLEIQDPSTHSPLQAGWQGVSVMRLSELEVQFSLGASYGFFSDTIQSLYPIPQHIFGEIPSANWQLSDYNLKPVGSGPYKFDAYSKESTGFIKEYQLKPNSAYANTAPYIETVRFAFFSDGNSLIDAFNKGAIDGITSPDLSTLGGVKRSYREYAFNIPSYYAVFINQSQNVPLQDIAVREALSISVDREALVRDVFDGHALPAYGPIPPSSGFATATSSAPLHDKAEQILEDAGWKVDADGIRKKTVKGGSIRLEITLTVPEIPFLEKTADELRSAWQKLGAQVTVNPLPTGETMAETINKRGYQMLLFGNVLNPDFDLYPFWNSKERFSPGLNLALYSNKTVDTLTKEIEEELNQNARIDKLHEAERAIVADFPAIFLYSPEYLYLASKEVRGIEPRVITDPADRFLDFPGWYIKTTRAVAK